MKAVKEVEQQILDTSQDAERGIFREMFVSAQSIKFFVDSKSPVPVLPFAAF